MNYKIDIKKMVVELIPTFLRKRKLIYWLWVLVAPIESIYDFFQLFIENIRYRIRHNSQVCYLEGVLNDAFDNIKRRIFINDGMRFDEQYVYTVAEKKDRYLGTIYLYDKSAYEGRGVDFVVWLPDDMILNREQQYAMEGLINYYKLAGKRYKIQNV